MDADVRQDEGEAQPQEPAAPAAPDADNKEKHEQCLHDIIEDVVVTHYDGPLAQSVFQQVLTVQLHRLAKKVLHGGVPSRCRYVGPTGELALGDGLALVCKDGLFCLCRLPLLCFHSLNGVEHGASSCGVGYRYGVAEAAVGLAVGVGCALSLYLFALLFARENIELILPPGKKPDGNRRHYHSKQQVGGVEETPFVGEECRNESLYSVAQCDAGGKEKECECLPNLEVSALFHLLACRIECHHEHHHGHREMVGADVSQQDVGEREGEQGEQGGVEPSDADMLSENAEQENSAIDEACEKNHSHHYLHGIHAQRVHEQLVELRERPCEECQQRVAIHLVACVPLRKYGVCDGVEARDVELSHVKPPVVFAQWRECFPETAHHKHVERSENDEQYAHEWHLLSLYFQHSQVFLHLVAFLLFYFFTFLLFHFGNYILYDSIANDSPPL